MDFNRSVFHNPEQPITHIEWREASRYCKKAGKRLPTEAEWEYSARAGSQSRFFWGDEINDEYVWYAGNTSREPANIGSKKPNAWGLYDMVGGVWEWVEDWYNRTYYTHGTKNNPHGYTEGEFKSLRGGSWVNYADTLRSAFRRWSRPDVKFNDTGFRCAKSVPLESEIN